MMKRVLQCAVIRSFHQIFYPLFYTFPTWNLSLRVEEMRGADKLYPSPHRHAEQIKVDELYGAMQYGAMQYARETRKMHKRFWSENLKENILEEDMKMYIKLLHGKTREMDSLLELAPETSRRLSSAWI